MPEVLFRTESLNKLSERLARVSILVADPDLRIASLVRSMITQLGFENVHTVRNGKEAVDLMMQTDIDIVITDWKMEPIDGIDFVRYLRAHVEGAHRRVPIIMLTGRGEKPDVEVARDAGINEFIVKPFQAKTLLDRLVMLVDHPRNFVVAKNFKGPDRRRRTAPGTKDERRAGTPPQPKMFVSKTEETAVENGDNFIMLAADYELKRKIGEDVNIRDILLPEVLRKVQGVIDDAQPMFLEWVAEDFARLEEAYQRSAVNHDAAKREAPGVQQYAFSIKAQSGIFSYNLASTVARLLYTFVEAAPVFDDNYLLVVKQHVDALRGIFQLSIDGDGAQVGRELIESLHKLAQKYRSIHGM